MASYAALDFAGRVPAYDWPTVLASLVAAIPASAVARYVRLGGDEALGRDIIRRCRALPPMTRIHQESAVDLTAWLCRN